MKRYKILLLFTFQGLMAQVQFEARVSKNTLGVNERLRIDFVMNVDGDNFEQPSFEGFRIVGGPSQQISQSWVNGRSSFQKIYSYFLLPNQKGSITIKQAAIEYNGQVYKTSPIKITVTNAVAQERDPNSPQQQGIGNETLNLVAEISKTNPYINEPVTVVYKLYFYNIGVTGFKELAKPKYKDFWNQNIDIKQLQVEEGIYKGERCYFVVLKKTILYPQKSGKLTIEPLSLDIGIQIPTGRDMFGRIVTDDGNKIVSAGAKTINVRALPETNKPIGFTGAVGKFDFKVVPSKTSLKNGESLDLIVSATGTGNMKLFTLPKPVVPNALEMYDPVHDEKVSTSLAGMSGKISDKYTIIPQYKGKYAIKPMEFSYFDLNSGSYKTITSPEIMIDVLDGPMQAEAVASNTSKNVISKSDQFKYIKPKTVLVSTAKDDFYGSDLYYSLLLLPFVILPIIVIAKKKKEAIDSDVTGNRIKMNNKLAKKYLSEAKKQLNNKEPFYIALEKAMHNFLKAKLHIETSEMSKDNIRELLLSRNANPETVQSFINLTENCEFARYAPASSTSIQQDYDKAVLIISELEKQIV
nr:BatD family protein [uncultured Flavobacterium sp.]